MSCCCFNWCFSVTMLVLTVCCIVDRWLRTVRDVCVCVCYILLF